MDIVIKGGRGSFYQWDQDQKLVLTDLPCEVLHFYDREAEGSITERVIEEPTGERVCNVPNILLTRNEKIKVWGYLEDEKKTMFQKEFTVREKQKPSSYIYKETEILTWEELDHRITDLDNRVNGIVLSQKELNLRCYDNVFRIDYTGTPLPNQRAVFDVINMDVESPVVWTVEGKAIPEGTEHVEITPDDIPQDKITLSNIMSVNTDNTFSHDYSEMIESGIRLASGRTYYVSGKATIQSSGFYPGYLGIVRLVNSQSDIVATADRKDPASWVEYFGSFLYTPDSDMTVSLESEMEGYRFFPVNRECMIVDVTELMTYPVMSGISQERQLELLAGYIEYISAGSSIEKSLSLADRLKVRIDAGGFFDEKTIQIIFESRSIIKEITSIKGKTLLNADKIADNEVRIEKNSLSISDLSERADNIELRTDSAEQKIASNEQTILLHDSILENTAPVIIGSKKGRLVKVPSVESPLIGCTIYGETLQEQTLGINKLDLREVTSPSGVSAITNPDGSITFNGSPNSNNAAFENIYLNNYLEEGKTYTLWQETNDRRVYSLIRIQDGVISDITSDVKNPTFVFNSSKQYFYYLQTGTIEQTGYLDNHTNRFMIYEGDGKAPVFEKFSGGKASPSPLFPHELHHAATKGSVRIDFRGRTEETVTIGTDDGLRGIGSKADYIDLSRSVKVRELEDIILSGNNEWNIGATSEPGRNVYFMDIPEIMMSSSMYITPEIKCTHFKPMSFNELLTTKQDGISISHEASRIYISCLAYPNDLQGFRSWLNANNVKATIPLAVSREEILQNGELEKFQNFLADISLSVTSDENIPIEVKFKYDTKSYIDEKIMELASQLK